MIYDVFGNGRLRLDANYGTYVGRLAETVSGQGSGAGNPASISFVYNGPDTAYLDSRTALQQAFQWFLDNGFTNRTALSASIPGLNTKLIPSGIKSPNTREFTLGAGTQIGKGYLRADYINREWRDFYAGFATAGDTVVTNPVTGALSNVTHVGNSSVPNRKYWGTQFQGQYQLPAGFGLGGNYTYSKLTGNLEGETSGSGPVTYGLTSVAFKEFQNFAQNAPTGYLTADQKHKLRVWGTYDIGTRIGHFNIGLIQRYDSGTPFSGSASITMLASYLCSNGGTFVTGGSYNTPNFSTCTGAGSTPIYPDGSPRTVGPQGQYAPNGAPTNSIGPTTVTYFFSQRGQYRWQSLNATDIALNYELPIHNFAFFAKAEVRNAFNRVATLNGTTQVLTNQNSASLAPFNPFKQSPIQCPTGMPLSSAVVTDVTCKTLGANYQFNSAFGTARNSATTFRQNGDFQLPRTFLYAIGARF
jgi:hypothetical protein